MLLLHEYIIYVILLARDFFRNVLLSDVVRGLPSYRKKSHPASSKLSSGRNIQYFRLAVLIIRNGLNQLIDVN
jgi:hypothetical protein